MADSIARLIVTLEAQTAKYQKGLENANKQLEGFGRTQKSTLTTLEGGFKKFSHNVHSLLAGGGILIGFRSIEHQLARVAEKFKETNPAAAEYVKAIGNITAAFDAGFLRALESSTGFLKSINDYFDPQAVLARELAGAISNLAIEQAHYNEALKNGLSLESGYGKALARRLEQAKQRVEDPGGVGPRRPKISPQTAIYQSQNDAYELQVKAAEEATKAQERAAADAKKSADATAQYNEDLVKSRIDLAKEEADRINEYNENRVEEFNKNSEADHEKSMERQAAQERALQDQIAKIDEDHLKTLNEQADAFGSQFADNLVQAADGGFKSVLESWVRTLEQMALKAAAAGLFKAIFSNAATGSFLGSVASFFGGGKAAGGPVFAGTSYMVGERGPEMFTPRVAGNITPNGGGGVVINQNIDARNATDPAALRAAAMVGKNMALVEFQDAMRRGRGR